MVGSRPYPRRSILPLSRGAFERRHACDHCLRADVCNIKTGFPCSPAEYLVQVVTFTRGRRGVTGKKSQRRSANAVCQQHAERYAQRHGLKMPAPLAAPEASP